MNLVMILKNMAVKKKNNRTSNLAVNLEVLVLMLLTVVKRVQIYGKRLDFNEQFISNLKLE